MHVLCFRPVLVACILYACFVFYPGLVACILYACLCFHPGLVACILCACFVFSSGPGCMHIVCMFCVFIRAWLRAFCVHVLCFTLGRSATILDAI